MTSAGRRAIPPVVPGYVIGSLIAHGTFAAVWSAKPLGREQDLAIKVVPVAGPQDGGQDADSLAFELSALASTRGRGEHFVEVHDVVAIDDPVRAVAIVMERLRYGTLARLVTTRGHLTAGEVVTVITPIAHTVGGLHDGALIHGDLSPSNIGFDTLGRPVLLDLGVSSVIGTIREHVYGTPGFVAPEVAAGRIPTAGADVYAVGALGWYALTGEPPAIPAERPPLSDLVPSVPEGLAEAIERSLDPEPDRRGTARDLASAVYAANAAAPISMVQGEDPAHFLTHRVRELARESKSSEPMTRSERRSTLRSRSRSIHLRVLATLVLAVLLGAAGVAIAATSRAPVSALPDVKESPVVASAPSPPSKPPAASDVLQGLLDARARAWTTGAGADLAAVFGPKTPMLASDTAALEQAAGSVYEDLEFTASDVRVHSESSDHMTLVATVTTSAYAVRVADATGSGDTGAERRPASESRLRLTLARADQGWRIAEVEEASGS